MAGLGETILNTLKFAAGGEGEVQQRVLNKQTIDANQRVLDKERDKQVAGLIDGTELSQFIIKSDPSDRSKPLRSFNVVGAYDHSPEATVEFLNTVPKSLLNAQDEKGNTISVKVKGIRPVMVEDQEMFAVEVVRPDGKVAPLTRRGTSSPDDNVILMSRDDLNGLATQRVTSMMNNGAFDNSSTFLRDMTDLQDAVGMDNARKEQALRDEVSRMLESDAEFGVAEKRELFDMFSKLEGDELLQAAADMGIDIDAVFEEYNAKRAAEGAEGEGAEGEAAPAGPGMTEKSANLHKTIFGEETSGKLQQFGGDLVKGVSDAASGAVRDIKAGSLDLHQGIFGGASDSIRQDKPIDPGSPANPVFADAVKAGVEAITPALKGMWDRVTGATPVDSSQSTFSPDTLAAPPEVQKAMLGEGLSPEERRAAILGALETNLAKPTGKATEYVRDYMIKNGYTSPESLSNAPSAEVMNIAFTIAANADVANSADRLKIANSLLNFAQFGNTETSALDVAKLQQARTGDSIAAQRLFFDQQKAELDLEEKDRTRVNEAYNEASGRTEIIRKAINTDDRGFWKKNPLPQEAVKEFTEVLKRARTSPDAVQKAAYQTAAGEILPTMLAAFALSEPRADIKEWITGGFQDFFTRAKYRQISTDAGDFRVTYDDKGNPKFLYLLTPKGDDAEGGQINMQQLVGRFGPEVRDVVLSMIKETGELINDEE
jgi:hypothetical protein